MKYTCTCITTRGLRGGQHQKNTNHVYDFKRNKNMSCTPWMLTSTKMFQVWRDHRESPPGIGLRWQNHRKPQTEAQPVGDREIPTEAEGKGERRVDGKGGGGEADRERQRECQPLSSGLKNSTTYTQHNTKTGRVNLRHHAKDLQIRVWCHWRKRGKEEG